MLKVKYMFNGQCLELYFKFINNELPHFIKSMFTNNHELYGTKTTVFSISILCVLLVPVMLWDTVILVYYSGFQPI